MQVGQFHISQYFLLPVSGTVNMHETKCAFLISNIPDKCASKGWAPASWTCLEISPYLSLSPSQYPQLSSSSLVSPALSCSCYFARYMLDSPAASTGCSLIKR